LASFVPWRVKSSIGENRRIMDARLTYLDNAASTRVDPRVLETMFRYHDSVYGNASSLHSAGREARAALDEARARIAEYTGSNPGEIVFTSGGTEANNLAVKGIAFSHFQKGKHMIVSAVEHDCVMESCRWLERMGFEVTMLPVDREGLIHADMLERMIRPDTILVSVMHANNEIGTIQPMEEVGALCKARTVLLHSDASQSFGKIPFDVNTLNVDLLTINSHKIYGPKGIGALFVRKGVAITPLLHGGGHESGFRSSTENVPGIVGFATAARLCMEELPAEGKRLAALRDRIIATVLREVPTAYLNGHPTRRLPNNVNIGFRGLEGEAIKLLLKLDDKGVEVSSGSACSANDAANRSHVLSAIGLNPVESRGALRITLGRFNTEEDIEVFLGALMASLRELKPITST
jgi:cysteine desulfurase